MARRRGGGFGDNPFGGGNAGSGGGPPGTRPNNPGPGANNPFAPTGGGGNNRNRNRQRNRNDRRNVGGGGGGGGGTSNPLDNGGDASDSGASDLAFENEDYYRQGAVGALTNAGADFGAGTNQVPWLNDQIQSWIDDFQGRQLNGEPDLTWADALSQQFGGTPAGSVAPTGSVNDPNTQFHTMNEQARRRKKRHRGGAGGGGGGGNGDTPAPATAPTPVLPANAAAILTRNWEAANPTQRGYDSRLYRAPKRTIAF